MINKCLIPEASPLNSQLRRAPPYSWVQSYTFFMKRRNFSLFFYQIGNSWQMVAVSVQPHSA